MDRRDTARQFRLRLAEAMDTMGLSRSRLARLVGIDRSTLSQLLSSDEDRLPRADTVAAIAATLKVSLDWLLGLSQQAKLGADILHESVQVKPTSFETADEEFARWRSEAAGFKLRYVDVTLPHLVKTDAVMRYEYRDFVARTTEQALATRDDRLAYIRLPETEMEICGAYQDIDLFARGEGLWRDLPAAARIEQLDHMIALTEDLYPSVRVFFFDGRTHYSTPYTIFGPLRAVVYVGQLYFVFNTTEHIRVLTGHFDNLIRAAVIQPTETPGFLRRLRDDLAQAR